MERKKQSAGKQFIVFSVALFLIILIAGSAAFIFSMQQIIRTNKGIELKQMLEIERIRLESSVAPDITLNTKLANSPLIKSFFLNPNDQDIKRTAFEEIASYRRSFSDNMIFWINDIDRLLFFDDNEPYWVDADDPVNYWYYMTLYETEVYNFNINYNPELSKINLWMNAPVFDSNNNPIGVVGTGIELTEFINSIFKDANEHRQFYFFNTMGEISGAKDIDLVINKMNISSVLYNLGVDVLDAAHSLEPGGSMSMNVPGGQIAIGTIPVLEWFSVVFEPDSLADYDPAMTILFLVVLVVILFIFITFNIVINRYLKSLRNAMQSLELASHAKSSFLATMSHEIRTPMNAIIGISEIELDKDQTSETRDSISRIRNSGKSLMGIINDILDLSKIETGKFELVPIEYDTATAINDTVRLNMMRIGDKPIAFINKFAETLPSKLYGDELRIKQVLNNILSNAIKYTSKGIVSFAVDSQRDETDEDSVTLVFTISDTGQGMSKEHLAELYDEYSAFNREVNRETEGTGLGMSITKNLLDMMGGRIEAESELGTGSTFTVYLRQQRVGNDVLGKEMAKNLQNFKFTSKTQRKKVKREYMPYGSVLIVDDVEANLFVANGLMKPYGLAIDTAFCGNVALDAIRSGKQYDIIFMDHMMPGMDGMETTKLIRESGYKHPIIALTANAITGQAEIFLKSGFDDFLSKPIDTRQLDALLNKWIRDKQSPEVIKEARRQKEIRDIHEDSSVLEQHNDTLDNLKRIDSLAVDAALDAMSGMADVYIDTVKLTVKLLPDRIARMDKYIMSDLKAFTVEVHGLKNVLKNIGASALGKYSAQLEKAALDNNQPYCDEQYPSFRIALVELADELNAALPGKSADLKEPADRSLLTKAVIEAKAVTENYDRDRALEIIAPHMDFTYDEQTDELLEMTVTALETFDCEKALECLVTMENLLNDSK